MLGWMFGYHALPILTAAFLLSSLHASEAQIAPPADPQAPDRITVQGTLVLGPGPVDFPDPAAGLAALASYKATLSLSFNGTEGGQASQWSQTYVLLATSAPLARQLSIEKTARQADPASLLVLELAGVTYQRRGEEACVAAATAATQSLAGQMAPVGFLNGVIGADDAGAEPINGVPAHHYTFDERALGLTGLAAASGEMWVSAEGGHVLKYALTTTATGDYFGPGVEGTADWLYELTEIGQPLAIAVPDDCPAGLVDAPLLVDAADIVSVPGLLTYTTLLPLADAVAFYQERLRALGWQQSSEPFRDDTTAVLDFTRSGEALLLLVTTGDGGTTVQLARS